MAEATSPGSAPINLAEYEAAARSRLPEPAYDYVAGGADDERTLKRNRSAFDRYLLRPRALSGVEAPVLASSVLGRKIALPIMLAPTTFHRLMHPDGELASARAAVAEGTIMVANTNATFSLESTAEAAAQPLWFQIYPARDRHLMTSLVKRAEAAGYEALVLTADIPVFGRRERDLRSGFTLPVGLELANFERDRGSAASEPALASFLNRQTDASFSWDDLSWLRSLSKLPLVVKGVMCPEDGVRAAEAGAAAIIVSNLGGRQLDNAPATIEVLESIVATVAGRCEVYLDSGIRRGTDVLTALALGARAVLIGRPYLWGLAVDGQAGVQRVLRLLADELRVAMMLSGCGSVLEVERSTVLDVGS